MTICECMTVWLCRMYAVMVVSYIYIYYTYDDSVECITIGDCGDITLRRLSSWVLVRVPISCVATVL